MARFVPGLVDMQIALEKLCPASVERKRVALNGSMLGKKKTRFFRPGL